MRAALVAAVLLALAACKTAPPTPPQPSLVLAAHQLIVARGRAAEIGLEITNLPSGSGVVTLAVTGLPTGVSAEFTPPTLGNGSFTSSLRFEAQSSAAEATSHLTISATGSDLSLQAQLELEVAGLTIDGRVRGAFQAPLAGQRVRSQGKETVTDEEGHFTLTGLSSPYDLTVYRLEGDGSVHVFEGLTSDAPVVWPSDTALLDTVTPKSAGVSGTVLGGGGVATGRVIKVCLEGFTSVVIGCDTVEAGETSYSVNGRWFTTDTAEVRVHALHYQLGADGSVVAFHGYANFDRQLTDGTPVVADLPPLAGVASVLLNMSFDAGALQTNFTSVAARFSDTMTMTLPTPPVTDPTGSFTLVPALTGATFDVYAAADGSLVWRAAIPAGSIALTIPQRPTLVSPPSAATGVDEATEFIADTGGRVAVYTWSPTGGGPRVSLTTARNSVTVPDTAALGLPIPGGAAYTWRARAQDTTDIAVAAAEGELVAFELLARPAVGGQGMATHGGLASSLETRTFTFALNSLLEPERTGAGR